MPKVNYPNVPDAFKVGVTLTYVDSSYLLIN